MNKKQIIFLLETISQPRCIKRIKSFISAGYEVEIYGFDRGKYNQNAKIDGQPIHIIGNLKDGIGYFNRALKTQRILIKIIKQHKSRQIIFYSFGFIPTLLLKLNGFHNYVYEISDLIYGYKKFHWILWFFKFIDRYLIKKSLLTVFTSQGFVNYLTKGINQSNMIVQPNRIVSTIINRNDVINKTNPDNKKLVFSFVGAFRSYNTIFRFARIIGENYPNFEFHFYGESFLTIDAKNISDKYDNVQLFGPFNNPEDLPLIYNNIDIVVACYDTNDLNEKILEPNKLYEALFFKKPIIASKNTFFAERVAHFGCGFAIDASSDENICNFLDSINQQDLVDIIANIDKIPLSEIVDDDAKKIINFLDKEFYKL
jgi:glycosyltransferase involved in cell wall biosynthesis